MTKVKAKNILKFIFKRKKKDGQENEKTISTLELFRFTDKIDKLLIFFGTLSAVVAGVVFELTFTLFGQIANILVSFETSKSPEAEAAPVQTNITNKCFQSQNSSNTSTVEDYFHAINMLVAIGFVSAFFSFCAHYCWNFACERQINRIKNTLFKSILSQDMAFFDKSSSGELSSTLNTNIDQIESGMNFKFADFINLMIRGTGSIILAMIVAWKFTIVFLVFIPIIAGSFVKMITSIRVYFEKEFQAYGEAGRLAQETLSSLRTVLAFGLERKAINDYSKNLEGADRMARKRGLMVGIFSSCANGLFVIIYAICMYYALSLFRDDCGSWNVGNLVPAFFCVVTAGFSYGLGFPFLKDLAEAKGAARRVFEIIDTKSRVDVFENTGIKPNKLNGQIEFENVFFSYPQRPDVEILKGLSFSAPPGKTIAIVGSSGGGKSTIIALLERFYLPRSGTIKIDGNKLEDLNLKWLRSQIALVSQEPVLFSTTIKENIRLGRLDATDAEIEQAAKNANAHDFIMATDKKYDTPVGERGAQLSGGQKQRIAIARALIGQPSILLLDEATSALDYESEKIVQDALDRVKVGRTTLIVAHRLSTIRNADVIVCLSGGQLKEMGTHDELMSKRGEYFELVQSQMHSQEEEDHEMHVVEDFHKSKEELAEPEIVIEKSVREDDSSSDSEETEEVVNIDAESKKIKIKPKKKRRSGFHYAMKLYKYHRPEFWWLLAGILGQLIDGLTFPLVTYFFSEIFNLFAIVDPVLQYNESLKYMGILLGIAVANIAALILHNYAFALVGSRLTKRLRTIMYEAMLRQEMGFHDLDENKSSNLSTQLSTSTSMCKGLTSEKLSILAQGLGGMGFTLIVGFILNWRLTLVLMTFVPICFLSGAMPGTTGLKRKNVQENGKITIETIDNIRTVVSLSREEFFMEKFAKINHIKLSSILWRLALPAILYGISNSFIFFMQPAAYAYGYYQIHWGLLTTADMFRIFAMLIFSTMLLGRLYSMMPDQKSGAKATKQVFRIIDRESKIDSLSEVGLRPETFTGRIRFENVYFRYPNRPEVKILNGLTVDMNENKTTALVGPSGCGKSTLIALLLRFYDVEGGTVYLDGVDIRKLHLGWLRSKIGLVSQEPTLFNNTIYENICFGDLTRAADKIELSEIIEVAKQSNIHDKITSLPARYDTVVGAKGSQLSGGEKQRIAICRALIRRPGILLLDEATSALDNASEHVVQDALDRAQVGKTCIVIAHRLTTIKNAHKIAVVKSGQLLEEGSHNDLMRSKGFYYELNSSHK